MVPIAETNIDVGKDTVRAVRSAVAGDPAVIGVAGSGAQRLDFSAAPILMLSFLAMSTGPETDIKILTTGLGAGILVDATIVRCLLVPALLGPPRSA